jgi:hypothetical protein
MYYDDVEKEDDEMIHRTNINDMSGFKHALLYRTVSIDLFSVTPKWETKHSHSVVVQQLEQIKT